VGKIILRAEGLSYTPSTSSKHDNERVIIEDACFELKRGEILGLAGESGAGKSTLLRLVARLVEPTRGSVYLDGVNWDLIDIRTYRRQVCLVPQTPVVFSGSVGQNLELVKRFNQDADILAPEVVIEMVGLEKSFLKRDADTLSGGEKQRLALARALMLKPKVLLLDEPASALDEKRSALVLTTISEICTRQGLSVILTSHIRQHIHSAHRFLTLREGRLIGSE